jgi:two-component system, chemotaxis family, protein-glutamate methylesterase/glutaminase
MSKPLRILVAHDQPSMLGRLAFRVRAVGFEVSHTAGDLTRAYDTAEHFPPDAMLLGEALALREEAQLLFALLRALGVGCVVAAEDRTRAAGILERRGERDTVFVPVSGDGDLARAFRISVAQPRCPGVQPVLPPPKADRPSEAGSRNGRLVLIGASTGGIDALMRVLKCFPADCPPTAIVQHTGARFTAGLVRLLDAHAAPRVVEASHGMPFESGQIHIAGGDSHHLELGSSGDPRCHLVPGPRISGHRPSVDALFRSATRFGPRVAAALLTGMGADGAEGLLGLRAAGAVTIGQDEDTSVVYGMPRVAAELGAVERQLPIDRIGPALLSASRTCVQ